MLNQVTGSRAYQQIDQINNNRTQQDQEKIAVEKKDAPRDRLEISQQARELSSGAETHNLKQVQSRIDEGFYNRPEVLRTVARKISNDLHGSE